MATADIRGDEQLERLYKRIRAAGDNDLRKELLRGIRVAVKPLVPLVKDAARSDLPQRGGLADEVASSQVSSRTRTTSSRDHSAGVKLVAQKERPASKAARKGKKGADKPSSRYFDLAAIDRGEVRHPVFGNRREWAKTNVKPGFWTDTINDHDDEIERDIVQAMDNVAAKIAAD